MCVGMIQEDGSGIHVAGVCLEGHVFHLCWLGVLKEAAFPLFSLDGLEMMYHHSKWASSELCSFCRLCCWDLGSCMNDHNPRFQLQFLSTMSGDMSLIFWERAVLVHSLLALIDPLLYGFCQTVPSVCSVFQWVSAKSDIYWSVLSVLEWLLLVLIIHEVF